MDHTLPLLLSLAILLCALGQVSILFYVHGLAQYQKRISASFDKALEEIDEDLDKLFDEINGNAAEDLPKRPGMEALFRKIIENLPKDTHLAGLLHGVLSRDLGTSCIVNGLPSTKVFNSLDEFLTFMHERHPEAFTECKNCGQKH